jgi:hypothetical protein
LIDNAIPICRLLILTFRIEFDNDELAGGMTPIQRIIVPYCKDAIGFGSIIHHTKSKKTVEMVTNLVMKNLSLTRGSHQEQLLKELF